MQREIVRKKRERNREFREEGVEGEINESRDIERERERRKSTTHLEIEGEDRDK